GDYDTVAGWLITKLGRIPQIGEVVKLDGFRIHILEADPRRVSKVRMQRLTQPHP
ncbi:MAG: ion transporter, partial [Zetaproteobacteria bacterium CG23_combo_of_CG06-09_8_20_14_all_54_7]